MTLILYPNVILAVRLIRFRICNNSKNKYEKIVSNEFHSVDTMYYIISIHFGFTVLFCSTQYAVGAHIRIFESILHVTQEHCITA